MTKLFDTIKWRIKVSTGEIVGDKSTYFGWDKVTQKELTDICEESNIIFELLNCDLRIGNSMGEIRPLTYKKEE